MHVKSISVSITVLALTMAIGAVAAPIAAPAAEACLAGFSACDNMRYPVGIVVCDGTGKWVNAANCGAGQSCAYFDGIPHCV